MALHSTIKHRLPIESQIDLIGGRVFALGIGLGIPALVEFTIPAIFHTPPLLNNWPKIAINQL